MPTKATESIKILLGSLLGTPHVSPEIDKGPVAITRPFTLASGTDMQDPLLKEIMESDMRGLKTPLELMRHYADGLNRQTSYDGIDRKLDKLFLCGRVPETLDGYYHGVTIGLKTGLDSFNLLTGLTERLGLGHLDPAQVFYATLLSKTSPWAGKNFKKIDSARLAELADGMEEPEETAYLGINSFRKDNNDVVNNIAGYLLSTIIDLDGVPPPSSGQSSWINAKGGFFIAKKQTSVDPQHPEKEVIALNYRWKGLGNKYPNKLLIDEIVEIAGGLYLGKLYYATAVNRLLSDFDPTVDKKDYGYRGFGYFLLMDDSWLHEKDMLFPGLTYKLADNLPAKFEQFRFIDSQTCASAVKLPKDKTVLHHLKELSDGVKAGKSTEEQYFGNLHDLFLCGEPPKGISGFLHGGVVAFKSNGFLKTFGTNVLNDLWPLARPFSPWTGKTFTEVPPDVVRKYIGDDARHYADKGPVILGTNTYRMDLDLSLPATVLIENLDKAGMVVEYPDDREKAAGIYVKGFYFMADFSGSVAGDCAGKEVLQFNYRWPAFHTISPDNLCIDELVRIAEGLYLGQLLYSTRPEVKYSPDKDPSEYGYENFGYFVLMDDEWHAIGEFISFDK
ncbi:MAG: hypothetical protein HY956_07150 [Deltaproteobacteria bacterium]|nr:hypothetical protein [Deltaproteobacteria bacterium]